MFSNKNAAIVNETILSNTSSPPLTSSLHSRNSASSAQESAYLYRAHILRWMRLCLSGIAFGVALAIVGCTGHVVHGYNQTRLGSEWLLSLWPIDVDLKPTLGTILPAMIVTITSLTYIGFAMIPSPHSRNLHQVKLFLSTSLIALVTTLFSVLFHQLLLYRFDKNARDSVQTWTCKFYNGAQGFAHAADTLEIPVSGDQLIPAGFTRMCIESVVSQWMMVGLFAIEIVCCCIAIWGLRAEQKIKKSREMRYQSEKCESELE